MNDERQLTWFDLLGEVEGAILERGELTKSEIVEGWGLSEEEYRQLHRRLSEKRGFESGPNRVGGLRRSESRFGAGGQLGFDFAQLVGEGWEISAAARLTEVLDFKALERLLGGLRYTLRQARLQETGSDRRGTKEELAQALVVQHGLDLFATPEIREAVGKALRITAPARWVPGKAAARDFVVRAGFPLELMGIPAGEAQPDFEYLEGRFRLEPLHPFQKEVQLGMLEALVEPLGRRCIVTLPTGAGKTRVAVESLAYWLEDRFDRSQGAANRGAALWLAHTEELCEQAASCFRQVWEASESVVPLTLVRFWGSYTRSLLQHQHALETALARPAVFISTPQRVKNVLDGRQEGSDSFLIGLRRALGLIVIDEAHRAAAPTYQAILDELAAGEAPPSVVGLTATPFRMEYLQDDPEAGVRELKRLFGRLVEPISLGDEPRVALQERGVLASPLFEVVESATAIRIPGLAEDQEYSDEEIDRIDRVMATRADNTPRRFLVLQKMLPVFEDPEASVLYFGPSVHDAECMAFLLRKSGIRAAAVTGNTSAAARRQVVHKFKKGEVRVLCNCEVLTTGFDAPKVTHVVVARPTASQVLYEQMVGRGLRGPRFGGTAQCTIIDVRDEFHGPRPPLGYERFREVWQGKRKRRDQEARPAELSGLRQEAALFEAASEQPSTIKSPAPPIPRGASAPLDQGEAPGADARLSWPETWDQLSQWLAARREDERWKRELLERMSRHLRRGWTIDAETERRAEDLLRVASASGFRLEEVRREQDALFS